MKRQFYGVIATASNVGTVAGNYTAEMFASDFPQLHYPDADGSSCWVPKTMLNEFINMANHSIQPDKWLDQWRYACGLFVAHHATLYLSTYKESADSPAEAAASGQVVGSVKSATLGDASVTYDNGPSTMATEGWGDLNATTYGLLLASKARLVGLGGSYVL